MIFLKRQHSETGRTVCLMDSHAALLPAEVAIRTETGTVIFRDREGV